MELQPPFVDLEAVAEIHEGVAGNDRAMALDPQHRVVRLLSWKDVDADIEPVARRIRVRLALPVLEEPDDVGAAVARLLGGGAVNLHQVFRGIRQRRVNRNPELLEEALRVAL